MRALAALALALVGGLVGYQIGIMQNIAAQVPAAGAMPYMYPYHFGFGFFGFLFPLLFLFLIFGSIRAAVGGGHGYPGYGMWGDRRARLEEIHKEMHGEKPRADSTAT
jgi:hypothetical protein